VKLGGKKALFSVLSHAASNPKFSLQYSVGEQSTSFFRTKDTEGNDDLLIQY
jgi:hypothetical protein